MGVIIISGILITLFFVPNLIVFMQMESIREILTIEEMKKK